MKKTAKVFLIIFIIFNLIYGISNINTVAAESNSGFTEEAYQAWSNTGKATITADGTEKSVKSTATQSSIAATTNQITDFLILIPNITSSVMTLVVCPNYLKDSIMTDLTNVTLNDVNKFISIRKDGLLETVANMNEDKLYMIFSRFTIQNLVMGYYELFDINFFNNASEATTETDTDFNAILKLNISKYYYIIRNIALVFSALLLVYIGIRMAISTLAAEKAKYKGLLKNWLVGFILIFVMQFFVIAALDISKLIQSIIVKIAGQLELTQSFEFNVINRVSAEYTDAVGFGKITSVVIFWAVVYYELKFFMLYSFRYLEVAILIIVAPLITVTYSIDKSVDGRSQVFNRWWRELCSKIFIQNIHCVAYLIFLFTAANIAVKSPLLAILFFSALSRVEKIIRNLFKIEGMGLKDMKVPFFNK